MGLFVHPLHVGFVIFVPFLERGLAIKQHRVSRFARSKCFKGGDRTQLVEDLMHWLETHGCHEFIEVLLVHLCDSISVDGLDQASDLLVCNFLPIVFHELLDALRSDASVFIGPSEATQQFEYVL